MPKRPTNQGGLSRQTIWRRMRLEGLTREEAERTRRRKPGPKPKGSKRARAASLARAEPPTPTPVAAGQDLVALCDVRDLQVEAGSVDLVLTDPPYHRGALAEYAALGAFAARALRPGGHLVVLSGLAHLPEVLRSVGEHVPYVWSIAILHADDRKPMVLGRWITSRYKLALVFRVRPFHSRPTNPDVLHGAGREKGLHPWQQAEAEARQLVEWYSEAGGLVVDPMCGSGTSLAAALALGRRCLGSDRDPRAVHAARERLAAFVRAGDGN